jgi:anti-sigma-K factor RskA
MGQNRLKKVQPDKVKKPRQPRKKSLWERLSGFAKRHIAVTAIVSAVATSISCSMTLLNRYHPLPQTPPPAAEVSITVLQQDRQGHWIKFTVIIYNKRLDAK